MQEALQVYSSWDHAGGFTGIPGGIMQEALQVYSSWDH